MGPANKVKKMIEKEKKKEEISDVLFLTQYLNLVNSQIKQIQEQLKMARLSRKHLISIIEKIRKKQK